MNSTAHSFWCEYTEPGTYTVNITAQNLHSEYYGYNKYINNLTRYLKLLIFTYFTLLFFLILNFRELIIQHPVYSWQLDMGTKSQGYLYPSWIDKNGGKYG